MDPVLDDAAAFVLGKIQASRRNAPIIVPPGFGKTELLLNVEEQLRSSRRVLRVSFPLGDDAALAALVDTAGGLSRDLLNRVMPVERAAGLRWSARLADVEAALSKAEEETVLLVDEPRFDHRVEPGEELFAGRAVEMTAMLLRAHRGPKVLVGRLPRMIVADADAPLSGRRFGQEVPPAVRQLLTALAAAGVDVDRIPRRDLRLEALLLHDFARLCSGSAGLRRTMARLAVLRVPFTDDWLEQAGLRALSAAEQRVIAPLILSVRADGPHMLPAMLAEMVRAQLDRGDPAWVPDEPKDEARRDAAQYHRGRHQQAVERGDVATAVREELEEIHQLTEAGEAGALLDRSLQFVEQYDALGRALSRRALTSKKTEHATEERLRLDAVRAYERALAHDAEDAYAHHYLAYNLDILGREPERVDREFAAAIDGDPSHPWYHGRYICFLITRARMTEARAGWERALVNLSYAGAAQSAGYYRELHAQVARHLLARSQLAFAHEVLNDVPEGARERWWRALDQLRVCLEEDRDDRLVFPPTLALDERWSAAPHFAAPEDCEAAVSCWRPGRVVARDEAAVILHVGEPDGQVTRIVMLRLDEDALEAWGVTMRELSFGTFVELIEYDDGTKQMERWDAKSASFTGIPDLPRLFPFSDRYLRRAPA